MRYTIEFVVKYDRSSRRARAEAALQRLAPLLEACEHAPQTTPTWLGIRGQIENAGALVPFLRAVTDLSEVMEIAALRIRSLSTQHGSST
jgi:hypothetical protein